jgi:hypothetical protein
MATSGGVPKSFGRRLATPLGFRGCWFRRVIGISLRCRWAELEDRQRCIQGIIRPGFDQKDIVDPLLPTPGRRVDPVIAACDSQNDGILFANQRVQIA